MENLEIREEIIETCRKMNSLGLNHNTCGNISVRCDDKILITPSGMDYDLMRPKHIVEMGWDGSFKGDYRPSGEWHFHADILKNRADANAVIHAHAQYCMTIAVYGKSIPAIHYMVTTLGDDEIPCVPFVTPTTPELSKEIINVLGEKRTSCLLANHGVITLGPNLATTLARLVETEQMAGLYWRTLAIGDPVVLNAQQLAGIKKIMSTYGQQAK